MRNIVLQGEVLCQPGIVNCSIALLEIPVITTQMWALSNESWLLQHLHIACCCLMALQNLKLHCSVEGKQAPKNLMTPPLIMPIMLEATRNIEVNFFLMRESNFLWVQTGKLVALKETWSLKMFFCLFVFEALSSWIPSDLPSAPVIGFIWDEDRLASWRTAILTSWLSTGENIFGVYHLTLLFDNP